MRIKTFMSVVVYTRDEGDAAVNFVERLGPWLAETFELYEIVVVDDASEADVMGQVRSAAEERGVNVAALRLSRRHGVEAGIKAGLDRALGDWIVELESPRVDFPPDLIRRMYETASTGHDVVTASCDEGRLRSRLFYRFVNRYADLDVPLRTEHIRLTSRRALNEMLAMREKVRYRKALYAVLGHRHHHLRYEATPSCSPQPRTEIPRESSGLAFDVLLSFSSFGLSVAHRLSFAFGSIAFMSLIYTAAVFFFKNDVAQGWTTITALISGGFAGIFLVLGILGEYLARILIEVRARPLYSVLDSVTVTPLRSANEPAGQVPVFIERERSGRPADLQPGSRGATSSHSTSSRS